MPAVPPIPAAGYDFDDVSADTLLKEGEGVLVSVFCVNTSSLVIKLWDNTAASGRVIVNDFTPAAATLYTLPAFFKTGLYFDVISGSGHCTVFFI